MAQVLRPVQDHPATSHADLLIGLAHADDAGVYALGDGRALIQTIDIFTPVVDAAYDWGRIAAAAGRAGVDIRPEALTVTINGLAVLSPGYLSEFSEEEASKRLAEDEVVLGVDLGTGAAEATTWTCDLTRGYIDINASYRS